MQVSISPTVKLKIQATESHTWLLRWAALANQALPWTGAHKWSLGAQLINYPVGDFRPSRDQTCPWWKASVWTCPQDLEPCVATQGVDGGGFFQPHCQGRCLVHRLSDAAALYGVLFWPAGAQCDLRLCRVCHRPVFYLSSWFPPTLSLESPNA